MLIVLSMICIATTAIAGPAVYALWLDKRADAHDKQWTRNNYMRFGDTLLPRAKWSNRLDVANMRTAYLTNNPTVEGRMVFLRLANLKKANSNNYSKAAFQAAKNDPVTGMHDPSYLKADAGASIQAILDANGAALVINTNPYPQGITLSHEQGIERTGD